MLDEMENTTLSTGDANDATETNAGEVSGEDDDEDDDIYDDAHEPGQTDEPEETGEVEQTDKVEQADESNVTSEDETDQDYWARYAADPDDIYSSGDPVAADHPPVAGGFGVYGSNDPASSATASLATAFSTTNASPSEQPPELPTSTRNPTIENFLASTEATESPGVAGPNACDDSNDLDDRSAANIDSAPGTWDDSQLRGGSGSALGVQQPFFNRSDLPARRGMSTRIRLLESTHVGQHNDDTPSPWESTAGSDPSLVFDAPSTSRHAYGRASTYDNSFGVYLGSTDGDDDGDLDDEGF